MTTHPPIWSAEAPPTDSHPNRGMRQGTMAGGLKPRSALLYDMAQDPWPAGMVNCVHLVDSPLPSSIQCFNDQSIWFPPGGSGERRTHNVVLGSRGLLFSLLSRSATYMMLLHTTKPDQS